MAPDDDNKRKTPTRATPTRPPPTLFQDFLLGRPSPQRTGRGLARRKSLENVKRELRLGVEEVKKVPPPGGVQARVKEWQKGSGAVDVSADEGRRKSKEAEDAAPGVKKVGVTRRRSKSAAAPKKRVISDEHWKKETPKKSGLPKDFVAKHAQNPTPKKKIEDWVKRNGIETETPTKPATPIKLPVTKGNVSKGSPIPKDFLTKNAANPSPKKKMDEWLKMTEHEEIVVEVEEEEAPKVKQTPKKRVISTSNTPKKAKLAEEPNTPSKGSPLPKDFIAKNAQNPTPKKKMEDWLKMTEHETRAAETPRSRASSRKEEDTPSKSNVSRDTTPRRRKDALEDDGIRVRASKSPDDRSRSKASREPLDDGIRIKPSPNPSDDGIRIKPNRAVSSSQNDDGIRIKPMRRERKTKEDEPAELRTPRKRSEKHVKPPDAQSSHGGETQLDDETASWTTPSRAESKRKGRAGSPSDMSEIPFGNSAFSVLDLPLGAEAGTLKKPPPPKRNPSFGVPKVLKKVYTEAKNIVNETVDPARTGPNQPPSIESWLNQTSDPFVDAPAKATLEVPEDKSRRRSYKTNDQVEEDFVVSPPSEQAKQRKRAQSISDVTSTSGLDDPLPNPKGARETLPSMEKASPTPIGLRRRAATRTASSPKAEKKPLKEVFLDAFRGESAIKGKGHPWLDITTEVSDGRASPEPASEIESERTDPPVLERSIPKFTVREQQAKPEEPREPVKPLPSFPRRMAPTTGQHRLSTIASVETFTNYTGTDSTLSQTTASELSQSTGSYLSQTTRSDASQSTLTQTQSSIYTSTTASTLSRQSHKSGSGSSLKRRLTKHSDLISVLSLPDTAAPGRAHSIKSARSVRTTRSPLETATLQDLMRELAADEVKYMRELKTLVDGVIPVLLTSVMSKSESAIAAGLFTTTSDQAPESGYTKPIVDMGVSLERLKSLHNRIPLEDPVALVLWLHSSCKTYNDYLTAWRSGFQDVVVNLAPTSPAGSAAQSPTRDEMRRNADGDVIKEDGERVDVAFLLKRPLVRVKYLNKLVKGFHRLIPSPSTALIAQSWEDLEARGRRRTKEEAARMVDRAANMLDTTRARDVETLALAEDVKVDQTRQVCAKDLFSLSMLHSSGQRIECEVDLLLRDKPSSPLDEGDLLICAVDEVKKWLLFPPVPKTQVSARIGDSREEVVIMVRDKKFAWQEMFVVKSDDEEAAAEWVDMLGSSPMPPAINRDDISVISKLATSVLPARQSSKKETDIAIPIGEQRRREAEEVVSASRKEARATQTPPTIPASIGNGPFARKQAPKDLNEAMKRAGKNFVATKHARARYHSRSDSAPSTLSRSPSPDKGHRDATYDYVLDATKPDSKKVVDETAYLMSGGISVVAASRERPVSAPALEASSVKELIQKETKPVKEIPVPATPTRNDGAPPPPVHRVSPSKKLSQTPEVLTPQSRNRRTSSPLKHEYQPSNASGSSSSASSDSEMESEDSYTDSSEDEELEAAELPPAAVPIPLPRVKKSPSIYSLPNTSLAPSNSASQGPYRGVPVQRSAQASKRLIATISAWDVNKWVDLHSGPCSIVVSGGLIEAFEMNASHSSPNRGGNLEASGGSDVSPDGDAGAERPLIAQVLTPVVNLRQSTAVDIEIKSPPTSNSLLKVNGATIRYRTYTVPACLELYSHIHRARCSNPVYEKLAQERLINSYGTHSYEAAVAGNRRRSWLGRKNSYRASARAPSSDGQSANSHSSSTFARLRRMSGSGMFNIAKSTVTPGNGNASQYTESSRTSTFSGPTPPRTPTSPSLSGTVTSGNIPGALGDKNLKIRLYLLATSSAWEDKGPTRLDITAPPPGMKQRSSLYTGIERRIIARSKEGTVVLDEVLGAGCFQKVARTGIAVNVWEDLVGDNGEVGQVGKTGGVSGRTRKWLIQTGSAAECNWIFGLCASGGSGAGR